jgi:hypothetical protein
MKQAHIMAEDRLGGMGGVMRTVLVDTLMRRS